MVERAAENILQEDVQLPLTQQRPPEEEEEDDDDEREEEGGRAIKMLKDLTNRARSGSRRIGLQASSRPEPSGRNQNL